MRVLFHVNWMVFYKYTDLNSLIVKINILISIEHEQFGSSGQICMFFAFDKGENTYQQGFFCRIPVI